MGLQIRVRHALGERVIELPDRMAEEPVIVGRASNAEVSVPSVTVAPKHCVLFIHEGHWAVQDLGSGGGTYVNGEPAREARFLQIGDVITVGADASAPTIEVDPAAAAAGHTGFAGTGLPHLQAQEAAPGYGAFAPAAAAAPSMVPGPMYGAPGYTAPAMAARAAPAQHYAGAYDPHASDVEHHNGEHHGEHHHDDAVHFEPAAVSTRPYSRRKQSSSAGMVAGMVIAAVLVIGGVWGIVAYLKNANDEKVAAVQREQQRLIREAEEAAAAAKKRAAAKPSNIFGIEKTGSTGTGQTTPTPPPPPRTDTPFKPAPRVPNGGSPGNPPVTPATPPSDPKTTTPDSDPVTPPKSTTPDSDPVTPKTPAKPGTPESGTDVRKPATPGGSGDGMDTPTKKPATPAIPPNKDPETMDPAAAASWAAMQELAKQPGKESFAVLRFEDFRRLNPGVHDTDLDKFIDQKLDRIWWERIDLLMKKIERLNMEIPKLKDEIVDINDPVVKKQKIEQFKKMGEELAQSANTLKKVMKYDSSDPPNLNSESELATLAAKRDKEAYETWKKITTNYIKANQGRLAWANEF